MTKVKLTKPFTAVDRENNCYYSLPSGTKGNVKEFKTIMNRVYFDGIKKYQVVWNTDLKVIPDLQSV